MVKAGGWLRRQGRTVAAACLIGSLSLPACTGGRTEPPPAVDDTARGARPSAPAAAPAQTGLTTRQKLVMLGGAAALYYLYRKHQSNAGQTGAEGQYYLSKNGRVYYRDAEHRAHWVTPPPQGIAVPEAEARDYAQFQGYDNRATGRDLTGLATDSP